MNEIPATVSSSLLGERACSSLSLFPKDPGGSKAVMALPPKSPTNEVTMAGPIGDAAAAHFEKQLSAKIYRGLFELARLIRRVRIIAFPRLQVEPAMSALGAKADICSAKRHVCFTPNSGHGYRVCGELSWSDPHQHSCHQHDDGGGKRHPLRKHHFLPLCVTVPALRPLAS